MPYISTEEVKKVRETLKKEFPNFKFSITKEHCMSIHVNIMKAPFKMTTKEDGYEQVNHYHIKEHYDDTPIIKDILLKIYSIVNEKNYTEVYDGDYGAVPSFYVHLSIGKWNKPFEEIK